MSLWIVIPGVIGAFLAWRALQYRRIYARAHYVELAGMLPAAKAAAIAGATSEAGPEPGDPRVMITSCDLVVFYTVRAAEGRFVHHASVSLRGRYTPHAVGRTFLVFVAERLGWDPAKREAAFGFSRANVFHAEIELDEAAQAAWARAPLDVEVGDDPHAQAFARGQALDFTPIDVAPGAG